MDDQLRGAKRRWLYLPWAIAVFVVAGYFVLWRTGAAEMKKGLHEWVDSQRSAGMIVSHGALKAEGFPFFLRVHIEKPDIAQTGEWRWRTDRLTLDALPYDLNRLIFSIRSEQHISFAKYGDWRIQADDVRASIANDKKRSWVFAFTLGRAIAQRDEDGAIAEIDSLVFDLAPDAVNEMTLVLSLAAADAHVSASGHDARLDSLQTVMAATQAGFLGDAQAWRDAGGALIINGLIATLGEASLSVAGDVRLDHNNLPEGQLTADATSPAAFARALAEAGVMSVEDAESLAATLTLTAIASGGKITAPIEIKDGAAHLAGIRIADFSRID